MNKTNYPKAIVSCENCFALTNGKCKILTKCEPKCNFYKTKKEFEDGLKKYPYDPLYAIARKKDE